MRVQTVLLALGLGLVLAACAAPPPATIDRIDVAVASQPRGVARSNVDLAEDFLELTFQLESGERLERLLRYEAPIRVRLSDPEFGYRADLDALLDRLRDEADLDIALTDDDEAQITIESVPRDELSRTFPSASCFIVPGRTDWRHLSRSSARRNIWSAQRELGPATIFVPADGLPQDIRDCLHEEVTQALGPANDLYRLPDSVWNDDNVHGAATPFDMLMLRVLYQPELHSGISRQEAAAILMKLLARENPQGRNLPRTPRHPESRAWARAIETALAPSNRRHERIEAARLAAQIATEMRPTDHRLGVSLIALGRLTLRHDKVEAARLFAEAYATTRRTMGPDDLRTAQAAVHLAAVAVAAGRFDLAIALADRHGPAARRGQNAVLLASLLSLKAEALARSGEPTAARKARLDSLLWARYGFGDPDGALAREQAALAANPSLAAPLED